MKVIPFLIPLALAGNVYSLENHNRVEVLRDIRVGDESVRCQYYLFEEPVREYTWITVDGRSNSQPNGKYISMEDDSGDRLLDSVYVGKEEGIFLGDKYHRPAKLTEEERQKEQAEIKKYQPEFERYLALFGPECGKK